MAPYLPDWTNDEIFVNDAIKDNLMSLLKRLTCCGFVWQREYILVVKGA